MEFGIRRGDLDDHRRFLSRRFLRLCLVSLSTCTDVGATNTAFTENPWPRHGRPSRVVVGGPTRRPVARLAGNGRTEGGGTDDDHVVVLLVLECLDLELDITQTPRARLTECSVAS